MQREMAPAVKEHCEGTHRYFVAETGTVGDEGRVCIIIVCTSCGKSELISHTVVGPVRFSSAQD